jgi:hypothetical protein
VTPELLTVEVIGRHKLTSLHLFIEGRRWRVFGFRKDPKGYQASVENGSGATIIDAIENLNARLVEGPIHK